jgi:hypothetical protein
MPREPEEPIVCPINPPLAPLPADYYGSIDDLVIRDDTPVDSVFIVKQQQLLTATLYVSWHGGKRKRPFLATSWVGLFYRPQVPPLVPDAMLALDVVQEFDPTRKEHQTYFIWTRGKPPDVVIEIVSDRRGGEETHKLKTYAKWGIPYYVIFDPWKKLRHGVLRVFIASGSRYVPLATPWFEPIGLGLTLWEGTYEHITARWLRWCDARGRVFPTGQELADREQDRARKARRRADQEQRRADQEQRRADEEQARREQLEARLRELGIDPTA